MNEKMKTETHFSFMSMFLLSLLTNKDSSSTQIIQCVNDTIFRKRFRVYGIGTGSGTLEPVPWNRFLRQITTSKHSSICTREPGSDLNAKMKDFRNDTRSEKYDTAMPGRQHRNNKVPEKPMQMQGTVL